MTRVALQYLKQVSRIKHSVLEKYLDPWATILGSANRRLSYVDCFAGGGAYVDEENQLLPGSPVIALRLAREYVDKRQGRSILLGFVEKNAKTAEQLRTILALEGDLPNAVNHFVREEDAQDFVQRLVSDVRQSGPAGRTIPTFFFVDPYGHPITAPVIRELLSVGQNEVLVNLMWFRLNMDIGNPLAQARIDKLFGQTQWREQNFLALWGRVRENAIVSYFIDQVGAQYPLRLAFPFSPEDRVKGRVKRTKFYLIHFSSHRKAALLMKDIMLDAHDELEQLRLSGPGGARQLTLPGDKPDPHQLLDQLSNNLLQRFRQVDVTFEDMRIQTLDPLYWPYKEMHYRRAAQQLEKDGVVTIKRVESKKHGLKGRDTIVFP